MKTAGTPLILALTVAGLAAAEPPSALDFRRDVLPILSDACFRCHGPDPVKREAKLRLDQRAGLFRTKDGITVVSPGHPELSELVLRITSKDEDEIMPPKEAKRPLSPAQVAALQRWVAEGARWDGHWAFTPPALSPAVPSAKGGSNEIDRFLRDRLAREKLTPSAEADRARLLRRVTFDLTGLPPTMQESAAFQADTAPQAYERVVDRLLASPRYGERMAVEWLDLARFADTHGYQMDRPREMWPWRDWVIQAFNTNLSYDRFVTEQLAGDLLPGATKSQRLATSFNRLHNQNEEGGIVEEEYRQAYIADRVATFGTAFLGLTLECARCHDHKYDPISQRDFYSLAAFFQNIDEAGQISYKGFADSMPVPTLLLTTDDQDRELAKLQRQTHDAEKALARTREQAKESFVAWLASKGEPPAQPSGLVAKFDFECLDEGKLENLIDPSKPGKTLESPEIVRSSRGFVGELNGENNFAFPGVGDFKRTQAFSLALWVQPPAKLAPRSVVLHHTKAPADAGSRGYEILLESGHVAFGLHYLWPGASIKVVTTRPVAANEWSHVLVTYDGRSRAAGARIYVNGRMAELTVIRDGLFKDITYGKGGPDLTIGQRFRDSGFTDGRVDDLAVFNRELTPLEAAQVAGRNDLVEAWTLPPERLSPSQREGLFEFFAATVAEPVRTAMGRLLAVHEAQNQIVMAVPEVMVMQEMPKPKPAFVLQRGAYDAPGDAVTAAIPESLSPFPAGAPHNRLGLARWLLDPDNPLMARVTVNRFWQMMFGQGLVETSDNFGLQGAPPTHPELLDWLARDFIAGGWDVKKLLRKIALSASYRQSSYASPELLARDPHNVLLARGPARRLSAEMLRDQALAASGLLVEKLGGPSVKPYQPPGIWEEIAMGKPKYEQGLGADLYRRSLYTFWKRTVPPPTMMLFDAAERNTCIVRRQSTSTPLQALALLNDVQLVEAARLIGERLLKEGGATVESQIEWGFQLVTGRAATGGEQAILRRLFDEQQAAFSADPASADQLIKTGDSPGDGSLPAPARAASTILAQALLNFDETLMRR